MRIFVAGASGVIGRNLIPLLVGEGHFVVGMTRSAEKTDLLRHLGATPVVCDVFDREALEVSVADAEPDLVMHQLTDLPQDAGDLPRHAGRNRRIRSEGTKNLLDAAHSAGATRFLGQSVAWETPPGSGIEEHEQMILDADGLVVRYGALYGPGTWASSDTPPPRPRIHVEEAARRTLAVLERPSQVIELVED